MTLTDKRIMLALEAGLRAKNLRFKALWGRIALALEEGRQEPQFLKYNNRSII